MTILLSYLFYFVAASSSPLQRRWLATKRDVDVIGQIHFAFQVTLVTVVLSLLLPLIKPFEFKGEFWQLAGLTAMSGIFGAGFFVTSYIAQKHVEAGVSTLISNIYTPITIVLATVFLHESLSVTQMAGTVLLLAGIVLVSKKHQIGTFTFDKYFMLMLCSGAMLGIALTGERALQKLTGFTTGTILSWWSQCLVLGLATLFAGSRSQYSKTDIAVTGALRFLQSLSWVTLLLVVGNLSIVSAVTTFKVVIIFIAAALFLGERDDLPRKIIGSIIALAGLLLMK